jgi:hypothetical protein
VSSGSVRDESFGRRLYVRRTQGWEEAARASESWEGLREGRESFTGVSES